MGRSAKDRLHVSCEQFKFRVSQRAVDRSPREMDCEHLAQAITSLLVEMADGAVTASEIGLNLGIMPSKESPFPFLFLDTLWAYHCVYWQVQPLEQGFSVQLIPHVKLL